jgi:lipopolysaccharide export system protein LptA
MKFKTILKFFLGLFLIATIIYVLSGIKGKSDVDYHVETRADGEGMIFASFNKEHRKAIELKCLESERKDKGRIVMKKIEGLIYKKGRMNKDIKVFGDHGYAENNLHNFFIEKNARLISEDFTITSDHFTMKDRAEVLSSVPVSYRTDTLTGSAAGGMGLYLNVNTLKFYDTSGTYKRDGREFNYRTKVLWFIEKEKLLVMEKETVIRDDRSVLRGDWITLKFSDDLKRVIETTSQKGSYFYFKDSETNEIKEIKSENIQSFYDEQGHMTRLVLVTDAQAMLKNNDNQTTIASDLLEMDFDGPTGKPKKLNVPRRGRIENIGKTRFRVSADTLLADYDENGELRFCEGEGSVRFIVEEYRGVTGAIKYNIKNDSIVLNGENTEMVNNQNTFQSNTFNIDSKEKILITPGSVKSIIRLEKDNVLFSKDSIFINANKLTITKKENKFSYDRGVNLNQADIVMEAGKLEILEESKITASGRVSMSFTSDGKDMSIKGGEVIFNSQDGRIDINENAIIKSGENLLKAANIVIWFKDGTQIDRITGEEDINFIKEDLSGYAKKVEWRFQDEEMLLMGSPYIIKRSSSGDGGRTAGKVLKIDLKTDKITILSDESDRTETIIK